MKTEDIIIKFENGLNAAQNGLMLALIEKLRAAATEAGRLKTKRDQRALIAEVEKIIEAVLKQSGFEGLVAELIENFDEIDQNIINQQKEFNGLIVPPTLFTPQKRLFIESLTASMVEGGIRTEFVLPMQQVLYTYMRRREPVSELEKIVRESAAMDLKRWAGTTARDAVYGYQGAANDLIKTEYNMDGFIYTGGERENTRAQCSKWIRAGEQPDDFWEAEIKWAKSGGTYKGKKVSGFKKDTRLSNFAQNRGGHGCLHEAVPVFVDKTKNPAG